MEEIRLMKGNEAIAEAAIRYGCDGYFGYPITPQSEIMETLMELQPWKTTGMVVLQAESEVSAINMVYGGAGCGKSVMTSSSSPGVSLKQEGISYIACAELPCLIVNVMRGGPGLGTIQPSQADYFQAVKGGGHGDYRLIVLAPSSVQEMADFVALGFDLAFKYRTPSMIIADGIIGTIPQIIILVAELLMVFFTLFFYSKLLACFALLVAPVAGIVSWWFGRKLKTLQTKVQESEASYRSFLQESLANLLVVKAFANEEYSAKRLTSLRDERFKWVYKRAKMGLASSTAISVAFQLGYLVAFAYGAMLIAAKTITYGTMSVFLTLVNRVQAPVVGLAQQISRVVSVLTSAGRVMELQNIPLEEKEEITMETERVGVDIKELTFGYTDETVLENVSLNVKPGEFVAIIGESGIGKTTLIRLIMSFMSNVQGNVSFYNGNGESIKANASTRNFIAYVPQGNTLFSGTVRENILMGNLNATEEEMYDALKLSAGYDFVMDLPKGLDTVIGERGHGISEGQAQRIAILIAHEHALDDVIVRQAIQQLDRAVELGFNAFQNPYALGDTGSRKLFAKRL